jgi:hypothetical protein
MHRIKWRVLWLPLAPSVKRGGTHGRSSFYGKFFRKIKNKTEGKTQNIDNKVESNILAPVAVNSTHIIY